VSFGDRPTIRKGRAIGCMVYCIVATALVVFLLFGAAMGDCPLNDDGTGCENDGLIKFLMFPGSLIVVIVAGLFLTRWAMRDDD
jgi:hypothetical protein